MDERLLDDGDEVSVEHLVAAQSHESAGLIRPDLEGRVSMRVHRQHPDTLAPRGNHDCRAERMHLVDARRRILGRIVIPPRRRIDPSADDAERFGVEIRDDQKAIAFGARRVLDEILDEILPRTNDYRWLGRLSARQDTHLGGVSRRCGDHEPCPRARDIHADFEPLVGFGEDQPIRRRIGAERMRPHLMRSIDVVGPQIQICRRVRAPSATWEGRFDNARQVRAGSQVAESEAIPLVADDVGGPDQRLPVGTDLALARMKLRAGVSIGDRLQVDHRLVATVGRAAYKRGEFSPCLVDLPPHRCTIRRRRSIPLSRALSRGAAWWV